MRTKEHDTLPISHYGPINWRMFRFKKDSKFHFGQYIRETLGYMDMTILFLVGTVIVFSLMMIYSATMFLTEGGALNPSPEGYLMKQLLGVVIGSILLMIAAILPKEWYESKWLMSATYLLLIGLLVLTLILGKVGGGAQSWIPLGPLSFQPSELVKVFTVLLLGQTIWYWRHLPKERSILARFWNKEIIIPSGLILLALVLIFKQPDWGMIILIVGVIALIGASNILERRGNLIMYVLILIAFILVHVGANLLTDWLVATGDFRLQRMGSFVNPFTYEYGAGYQLIGAYVSFSRGGLFGVGIGEGTTKLTSLPAGHTDYILAVVGEELGLVGVCAVLILLFALVIRAFKWAKSTQHPYRRAVFSGMGILYLVQIIINVGGVAGVMPLTGVTLPFVSYGGTSMMVSLFSIGVLQAFVIQERRERDKRREERAR